MNIRIGGESSAEDKRGELGGGHRPQPIRAKLSKTSLFRKDEVGTPLGSSFKSSQAFGQSPVRIPNRDGRKGSKLLRGQT
mmetsp:Transcript_36224/g.55638  ORF Transcript_36224/g.55638 Transcript_36224/m.55638 type:complete len:80 (+) Transcript_36224:1755-1994(+)